MPTASGSYDGSIASNPWQPNMAPQQSPLTPDFRAALAIRMPETVKALGESDTQNLNTAWLHAHLQGSPLLMLEALARDPRAGEALQQPANAGLWAKYPQVARQLGYLNPDGTIDSSNNAVQSVATEMVNRAYGAFGKPLLPMPENFGQVRPQGSGGPIANQSLLTGKLSEGVPQQPLKEVVGPQGAPVYAPAAQAGGRPAFNPELYVNPSAATSNAAMIASYRMAPITGTALRSQQGAQTMGEVQKLNPSYDATQYTAKNKAYEDFTSGPQANTVRSLSVATAHLGTLASMVDALSNGNSPVFNELGNKFAQQTGSAAPTNFDAVKNIVADEVSKAVLGSNGALGDREAAVAPINRANSPVQLKGAIDSYQKLMGGQLQGLQRQYEKGTGRTDFNSMVSPEAQQRLGGGHPANIQAILDKYGGR